jgi:hypothetical protein
VRHFRKCGPPSCFHAQTFSRCFSGLKDAIPRRFEIEYQDVEHEHRIMRSAAPLQELPPLGPLLIFLCVTLLEFIVISCRLSHEVQRANKSKLRKPTRIPINGLRQAKQVEKSHSALAIGVVDLFISFCFQLVISSCLLASGWTDVATEEADDKSAYDCNRDHGLGLFVFFRVSCVVCDASISRLPRTRFQKRKPLFVAPM